MHCLRHPRSLLIARPRPTPPSTWHGPLPAMPCPLWSATLSSGFPGAVIVTLLASIRPRLRPVSCRTGLLLGQAHKVWPPPRSRPWPGCVRRPGCHRCFNPCLPCAVHFRLPLSEHRESLPLSLSFVVWLEQSVLDPSTSPAQVLRLGFVLVCVWASLRWGDSLWVPPALVQYQISVHALVGTSVRTKTTKRGMPWGLLAQGFLGCGSSCCSSRFLSSLAVQPGRVLDFLPAVRGYRGSGASVPSLDFAPLPPDVPPPPPPPPPPASAPLVPPPPTPAPAQDSKPPEEDLVSLSSEEPDQVDQEEPAADEEADMVGLAAIRAAASSPWILHNPRSNVVHFAQTYQPDAPRAIRMLRQDDSPVFVRPACGAQTHQLSSGPLLRSPPDGCVLCLRGACFSRLSQLD